MPAGAKMSIASMKAEPMMPKMSVTPLATSVSTKASEGVIFCTPATTLRLVAGMLVVMGVALAMKVIRNVGKVAWRSCIKIAAPG